MTAPVLRNRQSFVDALFEASGEDPFSGLGDPPAEAQARYKAAREPLEEALKKEREAGRQELWKHYIMFEGDAFNFAMECLWHGVRQGALAEEMRRHLLTATEG